MVGLDIELFKVLSIYKKSCWLFNNNIKVVILENEIILLIFDWIEFWF